MYFQYYNFTENPFNITADPHYFFSSSNHTEALAHLVYGIEQRKGILILTGEIGTGKTTLCRTLINQLDENYKTALILNPNFSDVQLLQIILKDFGVNTPTRSKYLLSEALNQLLLDETGKGRNVVLIIDEAQNLSVRQLEQVRLLSNLETEKEKLLQIILVGQPELCDKLKLNALRQLNQRISVRYHIMPLDRDELNAYISHRLNKASVPTGVTHEIPPQFSPRAIDAIYKLSVGTPRMINILCDRALLAGYIQETRTIDENIIHKCAREVGQK